MNSTYDAVLVVAFGGPEKREDVLPFLENVTRGRNIPRERLLEVAEHYEHFNGVSPLNEQVRELIQALQLEFDQHGVELPIYWGNRNWHPMLADTVQQMADDGIQHALALVLAAYSSYSSCRQYRGNIAAAQDSVGANAPQIDKIRVFYNHPYFVAANADRLRDAMQQIPVEQQANTHIAYTAHSIPMSMANQCDYAQQLTDTCRLVSKRLRIPANRWQLVYQSRSGRPGDPWLAPDIVDYLQELKGQRINDAVVMPIGFLSDHIEVLYDLDDEAQQACQKIGLNMVRAATVSTHPKFVSMLRELVEERLSESPGRRCVGRYPASHDTCPTDCCPAPTQPQHPSSDAAKPPD